MAIEYLKNNKARFSVYVGLDDNGKRIIARQTVQYINKKDAKEQYNHFVEQVRTGQVNAGSSIGLIDLCKQYLDHTEKKGRKPTTIRGYQFIISRAERFLGNPMARKVTPMMADQLVDAMVDQQLSPKTIRSTVCFLSSVYKQGIRWRILTSNPFEMVDMPQLEMQEKRVLMDDELDSFYQALCETDSLDFKVAVELALFLGLRRSEIMGLVNDDIDWMHQTITVNKSRHVVTLQNQDDALDVLQSTKTKRSNRTLSLPAMLVDDLKVLIDQHKDADTDFLILNELDEPMTPNALGHQLRRFEIAHNLPQVSLHGLRHSHATFMNANGYDITEISRQLGHSNNTTTLNIYTHEFRQSAVASRSVAADFDSRLAKCKNL